MSGLPWSHHSAWLSPAEACRWQQALTEKLVFDQPQVLVFGQRHLTPRLAAFLADPSVTYRYSGVEHRGQGWPDWFAPLLHQVNDRCGVSFNGCLCNLYRDGHDRMGWHADDEPEIDANQPIASLSLGATRCFQLRRRDGSDRQSLDLADGDLLVMTPPCQQEWVHGLPVRKQIRTVRLNLTFRVFRVPAAPSTTWEHSPKPTGCCEESIERPDRHLDQHAPPSAGRK